MSMDNEFTIKKHSNITFRLDNKLSFALRPHTLLSLEHIVGRERTNDT